nr:zinc finger, CCHC-type [Tanacetum cinerariifolium]
MVYGLFAIIRGRSSYARAMIELQDDVELKDTIVVAMPKLTGKGFYTCTIRLGVAKNIKNPSQAPRGVLVGSKLGFKLVKQAYRPVSTKPTTNTSENKKNDKELTKKVSNSNPFDVLNSVENDVDFGTNGGTLNLVGKKTNSSGSLFWKVESSSTTPIVDKIRKYEKIIIDSKVTLVDDEGNPVKKVDYPVDHDSKDEVASIDNDMACSMALEKVGFGTNSLLEKWRDTYENDDYNYDRWKSLKEKFEGVMDFRRWKKKMHFLLSNMSVVYVLTTPMPEDGGDNPIVEILKLLRNYEIPWKPNIWLRMPQVSCIIDKLSHSWKDFKHTLEHSKEELTLIELGSHCIKESLRVQDSDKPKGKNVVGPSVVNMVEHNNSSRYNDNKEMPLKGTVYANIPRPKWFLMATTLVDVESGGVAGEVGERVYRRVVGNQDEVSSTLNVGKNRNGCLDSALVVEL